MILERDIEKYLKERVEAYGGVRRRVSWQGRNGAPDDYVMLCGGHWVECKAPGKRPEPHQEREHLRMRGHGIEVTILDSYESVDAFIERILIA